MVYSKKYNNNSPGRPHEMITDRVHAIPSGNSLDPPVYRPSLQMALSEAMDIKITDDSHLGETPDEQLENRLMSLNIQNDESLEDTYSGTDKYKSFLLLDGNEKLRIQTMEAFVSKLQCSATANAKVVSIFGNTGDGKSHTMNHAFFKGEEVFRTSSEQDSCTMGVWAAMQPSNGVLCLDTEGLLGVTTTENQRTRMLLKVLAISDVIIYRTRSERLHSDMFTFLGMASKAFCTHFSSALQALNLHTTPQALGPAVIIFHETRNTNVLHSTVNTSPEDILRDRFAQLNMDLDAFSSIKYVGIMSNQSLHTDYSGLRTALKLELENKTVRSARQLSIIFEALKALNLKFSGQICDRPVNPFPEQYFTCNSKCESCGERCELSMGHVVGEGKPHKNAKRCRHQHQFENKVYLCKQCLYNGQEQIVTIRSKSNNDTSWMGLAKYALSGSVIECPKCGEIYRSRQYWYGNRSPEDVAVQPEIVHVWKGSSLSGTSQTHSARMLLDGVSYLADTVTSLGAQPTKAISNWATDKIAPDYWLPNAKIVTCHGCRSHFEQKGLSKHHCRGCGQGFCNTCTKYQMAVPRRGWHTPVRVCKECFEAGQQNANQDGATNGNHISRSATADDIRARKVGEVLINTISSAASILDYPKGRQGAVDQTNCIPMRCTNNYLPFQISSKTLLVLRTGYRMLNRQIVRFVV